MSAASAALLDLHPRRDPAGVGLTNATAATVGIGLGMLVSSSLVQIGWEPRLLPYLVLLVLVAIALAGAYWMPEPVLERSRFRLTVALPSVPAVVRRPFFLAALAVLSSWSIGALFFSLGPQLAGHLFDTSNAIVSGSGIVALAAAATIAQLLTARAAPWIAASTGSIALAAGMIMIVLAAATDSAASTWPGRSSPAPASAPPSSAACAHSSQPYHPSTAPRSCPPSTSPPTHRSRCPPCSPASSSHTSLCSRPSRSSAASSSRSRSSSPPKPGAPAPTDRPPRHGRCSFTQQS